MSDADPEAVTLTADGITVRKTVDTEQFQTLAVVVELASERDDVARVQLVDDIPPDVSMEDVGFHPNHGSEFWAVGDQAVAFERDFEPGEAYTTIYGIRDYPTDELAALMDEPTLGLVATGPDRLDDVVDEERSEVVREFISGEADLPGLEGEIGGDAAEAAAAAAEAVDVLATEDSGEAEPAAEPAEAAGAEAEPATEREPEPEPAEAPAEPEPAAEPEPEPEPQPTGEPEVEPEPAADDEPEPVEASAEEPTAEEAGGGEADDEGEVRVPLTGGVVRVLIKELREGDIDPQDRRMLRDELLDTEGTTEARISHLQQRVSDLEAYADALEAFIDQEGDAGRALDDLRDDVASVEREVGAVDDRLDEALETVRGHDDRLDAVADDIATVASREDVLTDRLEDAEDDIAAVDGRVDDLGARIDRVSTDVDGVDGRLGDVASQVDSLAQELQSLGRAVQAIEEDLEDFEAFRDRLSSAFGGGAFGEDAGGGE